MIISVVIIKIITLRIQMCRDGLTIAKHSLLVTDGRREFAIGWKTALNGRKKDRHRVQDAFQMRDKAKGKKPERERDIILRQDGYKGSTRSFRNSQLISFDKHNETMLRRGKNKQQDDLHSTHLWPPSSKRFKINIDSIIQALYHCDKWFKLYSMYVVNNSS